MTLMKKYQKQIKIFEAKVINLGKMEIMARYFYEKGIWDETEIYNLVKLQEISDELYKDLIGIEFEE